MLNGRRPERIAQGLAELFQVKVSSAPEVGVVPAGAPHRLRHRPASFFRTPAETRASPSGLFLAVCVCVSLRCRCVLSTRSRPCRTNYSTENDFLCRSRLKITSGCSTKPGAGIAIRETGSAAELRGNSRTRVRFMLALVPVPGTLNPRLDR